MQHLQQLLQFLLFILFFNSTSLSAQCDNPEYDLLASIYNNYDGPNWRFNNWDFSTCNICEWQGIGCNADSKVTSIGLFSQTTFTVLPEEFGEFEFLEELYIRDNDIVSIPESVFQNLDNLKYLDISANLFTSFPESIESLTNLKWLDLQFNDLNETIPTDFGQLVNLETLLLRRCKIKGPIPVELANLTSLTRLNLSENSFFTFPNNVTLIESLEDLNLADNIMHDNIPPEIGNLTNLKELNLSNSELLGSIPVEIGNLVNLETLIIRNSNLSGNIPTEIGNLQNLEDLILSNNNLSGQIPKEVFLPELKLLKLNNNLLSNQIPLEIGNSSSLYYINLSHNVLWGSIPPTVENLGRITNLDFSNNRLSGSIPPEIGGLGNEICAMEDINLSHNNLSGTIPLEFGNICFDGNDDAYLRLSFNQLTGSIPIELFSPYLFPHLDIFINNNNLSGCYDINLTGVDYDPCFFYRNEWISEGNNFDADWEDFCATGAGACEQTPCAVLDYAWLASIYESLDGPNWTNTWDLSNCNICDYYGITCDENNRVTEIDLADNNLSGTIPSDIYLLTELENLFLQDNQISGALPAEFSKLYSLEKIHLQNNLLESIGDFRPFFGLQELRLNDNDLTGSIPSNFFGAPVLTLQNNMLEGELPRRFIVGSIFNISNNELSGSIDPLQFLFGVDIELFDISSNQFEGCYNGEFRSKLCGFPNEVVSAGNQFIAAWEDFCFCQAGICLTQSTNIWRGEDGSWDDPQNWTAGHVPLINETVLIPYKFFRSGEASVVRVPKNFDVEIYTIEVEAGAQLITTGNSCINVLTNAGLISERNCEE